MSKTVQVGPNLNPAKRRRKGVPVGGAVLLVLLFFDVTKWHVVHHLAGVGADWAVFTVAVIWILVRIAFRRRR